MAFLPLNHPLAIKIPCCMEYHRNIGNDNAKLYFAFHTLIANLWSAEIICSNGSNGTPAQLKLSYDCHTKKTSGKSVTASIHHIPLLTLPS